MWEVAMVFSLPGLPIDEDAYKALGVNFSRKMCQTPEEIIETGKNADIVIGIGRQPFNRTVLENLPKCRLLMCVGIGYDNVDVAAATELGIPVANVPDASTDEVSDHVLALLLALSRRLLPLVDAVRSGGWDAVGALRQICLPITRLKGKTLGLVGFGNIARRLTPKAQAIGLDVLAYDPYVADSLASELGVKRVSLDRLLESSDFVSLHAALTHQNKHMIGLTEFTKMKETAFLINASRGGLVNEEALVEALTKGLIAGAGLDVLDPEPPKPDNPLLGMPNVLITAHSAYSSQECFVESWERPVEEVARALKGEWPLGLVNPDVKEAFLSKWQEGDRR